jgi:integrase
MTDNRYPYAGSYLDRHGKRRWRFRRGGRTVALPSPVDRVAFDVAYQAAVEGRPVSKAKVLRLPTAAVPRSLGACWRILISDTPEWQALDPETRANQTRIAERFLLSPVVEGEPLTFGALPIDDLRRRHVKAVLARYAETPHAGAHVLRLIRKLTGVALDQEWIENDPTYRLKYRPPHKGWKAWPAEVRAQYEARWPIGSTPRLAYALALDFCHRRSDVARVKWTDFDDAHAGEPPAGGTFVLKKGGKELWLPVLPEVAANLAATERKGDYVLNTQYGRPFTAKGLTVRMRDWTKAAGLPPGYTLHGLRKTRGKLLAESGATTRQLMAILGHSDIAHAELYTREAEQKRLAEDGMRTLDKRRG